MKNKIIFFICIFFSFAFISNAKALDTLNMYYDSEYTNQIVANTPVDDINTKLIPFIEQNMQDYYVSVLLRYSTLNSVPSSVRINISTKVSNKIPAYTIYLRNGYQSYIRLSQPDSISGSGLFSTNNAFNTRQLFYQFVEGKNVDSLIETLQEWLESPTYDYTNQSFTTISEIDNVVTNNQGNFLNQAAYAREGLPYYFNYDARLGYYTDQQTYNAKLNVKYNNNDYEYNFTDIFPTYKNFITANTYLPPIGQDFGDAQYGYTSNQIVITDTNSISPVKCPQNTDFVNDFCYTNQYNYSNDDDLLNGNLDIQFDLMNKPEFRQSDYYVFTFRVHSSTNYLPTTASISSGQVSMPINIVKTNIINNGIYKDIQIILKANQSFGNNEPYALKTISLLFPDISTSEPNVNDFYFGIYKTYKFSGVGNEQPTQDILNNDYHNNDIDSIVNNDNNTSWFNKFNVNDRGLSNIITAPITLFQNMRNTSCTSIFLPVPHLGNIELPCISSVFSENLPAVYNLYQIIISGVICYYVGLGYFRLIKNAFTPDNDRIEVHDL